MSTPSTETLEQTAFILKTIAHPMRLKVVCLLGSHDSLTVSEICAKVECEQSLVSHHLNIMKLKGVLVSERNGKNIHYSLAMPGILDGKNIHYSLAMPGILGVIDCVDNCCNKD